MSDTLLSENELHALQAQLLAAIDGATDSAALELLRVECLGKKGKLTEMMKSLGKLDPDARKTMGAAMNVTKDAVAAALESRAKVLGAAALAQRLGKERIDITLSPRPQGDGRVHPITQTMDEIVTIFAAMGFSVAKGPEIETDWNNFTALNLPPDHPARQMQGHVLYAFGRRYEHGFAHAYLAGANPHDDEQKTADPHHRAGADLSLRL